MKTLRKLLWPLSPIYAGVVWLRNFLYDRGYLVSVRPATPILCIGNLSVGGSGKTPMVEWILSFYQNRNRNVAVLSRGYGRSTRGFYEVQQENQVREVGDEPLQLKSKFPLIYIAVDADRLQGIHRITEAIGPELIILDDGFQHRRVAAPNNILLTDWERLYPFQGYLPSGDLRDHRNQAQRADLIVVTKCPAELDEQQRAEVISAIKPTPLQQVIFASLAYDIPIDLKGNPISWESLRSKEVTLVTGIANPKPLLAFLDQQEISYAHLGYSDHHNFTPREINKIKKADTVLTTEKDAMRLKEWCSDFYILKVQHHFAPNDRTVLESFLDKI